MSRTYAQVRNKTLEVLRSGNHQPNQFAGLLEAVDAAFALEHIQQTQKATYGTHQELSDKERVRFVEVFWDLFREGVITLGINETEPNFPWFRITTRGRKRLETAE